MHACVFTPLLVHVRVCLYLRAHKQNSLVYTKVDQFHLINTCKILVDFLSCVDMHVW